MKTQEQLREIYGTGKVLASIWGCDLLTGTQHTCYLVGSSHMDDNLWEGIEDDADDGVRWDTFVIRVDDDTYQEVPYAGAKKLIFQVSEDDYYDLFGVQIGEGLHPEDHDSDNIFVDPSDTWIDKTTGKRFFVSSRMEILDPDISDPIGSVGMGDDLVTIYKRCDGHKFLRDKTGYCWDSDAIDKWEAEARK